MNLPTLSLIEHRPSVVIGRLRSVAWFLALLAVLHVPVWIAQRLSPAPTMLINIELLVSVLTLLRWRILGWGLVAFCYGLEAMRLIALNFHFIEPSDLVNAIRFAALLHYRDYLTPAAGLALLVVFTVVMAATWVRARGACQRQLPAALVAVMIQVLDISNGSSPMFGRGDRFLVPVNIAGSPLWGLVDSLNRGRFREDGTHRRMRSTSHIAIEQWHVTHPRDSVLVVLVESMGLPRSTAAKQWLHQQMDTPGLRERWQLSSESEPFLGSTTHGELRVLCGVAGSYTRMTRESGAQCLPAQWRAEGFETYGFHGFSMKMFDRGHWWPLIGLTPQTFTGKEPTHCNATFAGVCDEALLDRAVSAAGQAGRFVYALTLDTHLPFVEHGGAPRDPALEAVCQADQIPDSACELIARTGRVLGGVAQRAAALSVVPMIVVVGDHAPPFVEPVARKAFDASRVPLFVLTPR